MALNRTGYNNNHMVFYISLAVLMLVLAWRTQKTVYVFLTGAALALCLCTYKIATYIWIVLFLVLLIEFCRRPSVKQLSAWALVAIGFLLIISPNLFVTPPSELMRVANQYSGTDARTGNYWFSMSFSSFKNTIGAFWIDHNKGHGRYVHGAFIDIITKSLLILGIALSIMFFSSVECKIALLWFVVGMLIIPFTSYHPNASVTRLMFVIPAIALLSAISVNKIKAFLAKYELSQKKILVGFIALLVLIVPLNIYQLQVYGPEHGAGIHVLAMIVKAWQEYPQKDIVLVSNQVESRGYSGVTTFLNQYSGVHGKYIYINETESDLFVKENMSNLPIFLIYVNEKDIAANLSKKLPPEYLSIIDYNVDPIIYLLLPNQTTKKDFLTEEILRIFNPIKKYEDYLM